ncbi:hypothetical protein [Methylobacterium dankookense]|uniref:Uncharacterized protein n=1 Tax=Methylobacterium dankookense TaxID=560405 RepID=A0A564FZH4_9HYPH|nr:hypothetical protein [Methylobacterium dankookense]GJD54514.1 hypothetical protein IFDJLNFL_0386 [Methylobacterium dankookense]VUF13264.1 hypothetical protein MTDSW087_02964 [Methylobacterium dankookense]
MDEAESSEAPGSLLRSGAVTWALRVTAVAAIAAVGAAHYLARPGALGEPVPVTGRARQAQAVTDPEMTGSIGAARQTRLDPCALLRH